MPLQLCAWETTARTGSINQFFVIIIELFTFLQIYIFSFQIDKSSQFECDYCIKTFLKSDLFFTHCNRHHLDQVRRDWLACNICKSHLPDYKTLKLHHIHKHLRDRVKKEVVQCTFCQETFLNVKSMTKHANAIHLAAAMECGWLICPDCQAFFPDSDLLKNHRHQDFLSNKLKTIKSKLRCPICSEKFESQEQALAHAQVAHPEIVSSKWYQCDLCQISVPSKLLIRRHNVEEHGMYTCFMCIKNFSSKNLYYDHANR